MASIPPCFFVASDLPGATREVNQRWPVAAYQLVDAPGGPPLFDGWLAVLEGLSRFVAALQDIAVFGRIGRYYSVESMLVWAEERHR